MTTLVASGLQRAVSLRIMDVAPPTEVMSGVEHAGDSTSQADSG
jgi:hypothetical protein